MYTLAIRSNGFIPVSGDGAEVASHNVLRARVAVYPLSIEFNLD
jgi:hypothetical protein